MADVNKEMIAALLPEITKIAARHSTGTAEDLGFLLEYDWERAAVDRACAAVPAAALLTITARAVRAMPDRPQSPEAVFRIACDSALRWALAHHVTSANYLEVAGLIAAAVTSALLGDPARSTETGDGRWLS